MTSGVEPYWKVDDDNDVGNDYFLHLVHTIPRPDGGVDLWGEVTVKWDGCISWTMYYNKPAGHSERPEDQDTMHFCDVDEAIGALRELQAHARAKWPDEPEWAEQP